MINKSELTYIVGGALTGSVLNAIYDIYEFIYDLGKKAGSAFRRGKEDKYCSIN